MKSAIVSTDSGRGDMYMVFITHVLKIFLFPSIALRRYNSRGRFI